MHIRFGSPRRIYAVLVCALACLVSGHGSADLEDPSGQGPSATIPAVLVDTPPAVDGVLDDICWRAASHAEGFWRQKMDAPEVEPTEAWICCDERALYVAFRCHDSRASEIRNDQKRRQGSMRWDDRVVVLLDVEGAGRSFYNFWVNAAGTQQDVVPGGTSEKIEWKGDWRADARIDDTGWTAELEIPFAILRYPGGQDCFRLVLGRVLAREDECSLWPPEYARRQDPDLCAQLSGVQTPPVRFRYVLMPYALSVASEEEQEQQLLTAGLDFKGTFPNGVVALATYNPDFGNIEDVVETIDPTFVERYLPEYRPFFQEGGGYLPYSLVFYSRRVEDFDLGAKAFGTVGSHRFAVLDAYRRGGENHLVWNYEHLWGPEGKVRLTGVDRRVPGEPHNLAYALGTEWHWPLAGGNRWLNAAEFRSHTVGEGGDGDAVSLAAGEWRQRGTGWDLSYSEVGSEFRADDGYVPETGVRSLSGAVFFNNHYDEGAVRYQNWRGSFHIGESEGGPRRDLQVSHDRAWRNNVYIWSGAFSGERDGFDHWYWFVGGQWNEQDLHRQGSVQWDRGERYGYPSRYLWITQSYRPTQHWGLQVQVERSYAADLNEGGSVVPPDWSRQVVLTTTYEASPDRTVSARLVRRGSATNVCAAYRQRVRRGTDMLILLGDPNADKWVSRLAVKAMWCF